MDLYAPPTFVASGTRPQCALVFVYGGSWQEGDKQQYGFVGASFAKAGYLVGIPNYRKYPDAAFPGFIEDVAMAVAHPTIAKIPKIVLLGHSAGTLIAAHLSYNRKYLNEFGNLHSKISAFVSMAGPHDYFLPSEKPQWQAIFGSDPKQQIKALSVAYVDSQSPPTLVMHGKSDDIVTPKSAQSLADALQKNGVAHQLKLYPNIGHRRLVAALAPPIRFLAPTFNDIKTFLEGLECAPITR